MQGKQTQRASQVTAPVGVHLIEAQDASITGTRRVGSSFVITARCHIPEAGWGAGSLAARTPGKQRREGPGCAPWPMLRECTLVDHGTAQIPKLQLKLPLQMSHAV